jgi:hypothetical protein
LRTWINEVKELATPPHPRTRPERLRAQRFKVSQSAQLGVRAQQNLKAVVKGETIHDRCLHPSTDARALLNNENARACSTQLPGRTQPRQSSTNNYYICIKHPRPLSPSIAPVRKTIRKAPYGRLTALSSKRQLRAIKMVQVLKSAQDFELFGGFKP